MLTQKIRLFIKLNGFSIIGYSYFKLLDGEFFWSPTTTLPPRFLCGMQKPFLLAPNWAQYILLSLGSLFHFYWIVKAPMLNDFLLQSPKNFLPVNGFKVICLTGLNGWFILVCCFFLHKRWMISLTWAAVHLGCYALSFDV